MQYRYRGFPEASKMGGIELCPTPEVVYSLGHDPGYPQDRGSNRPVPFQEASEVSKACSGRARPQTSAEGHPVKRRHFLALPGVLAFTPSTHSVNPRAWGKMSHFTSLSANTLTLP